MIVKCLWTLYNELTCNHYRLLYLERAHCLISENTDNTNSIWQLIDRFYGDWVPSMWPRCQAYHSDISIYHRRRIWKRPTANSITATHLWFKAPPHAAMKWAIFLQFWASRGIAHHRRSSQIIADHCRSSEVSSQKSLWPACYSRCNVLIFSCDFHRPDDN